MDGNVQPMSEILQGCLVVVVCRIKVGHKGPHNMHGKGVATFPLHHLLKGLARLGFVQVSAGGQLVHSKL